MLRLLRNLHMEVHKVLRLPRHLRVKKQVKTLITMEGQTGDHRRQPPTTQQPEPLTEHGGSQSAAPATKSAHGGSQSAAPATISARQATSENSSHNGGTDRRPPATTADNRRQPPTTQQPEPLTEHGGSQSAAPAANSAHGASQSAVPAT